MEHIVIRRKPSLSPSPKKQPLPTSVIDLRDSGGKVLPPLKLHIKSKPKKFIITRLKQTNWDKPIEIRKRVQLRESFEDNQRLALEFRANEYIRKAMQFSSSESGFLQPLSPLSEPRLSNQSTPLFNCQSTFNATLLSLQQ